MKWHRAFSGLMGGTALLLPLMAVPESRIQTATATTASAHLDFKIVIPQVLYLHLGGGNERDIGAETVGIMSNGRQVTLNATPGNLDVRPGNLDAHTGNLDARALIGRNLILSAPARKAIAQQAQCTLAPLPAGTLGVRSIVCTASMP